VLNLQNKAEILNPMSTYAIIWDFDGTLVPNDPYDSEQSLMLAMMKEAESNISLPMRMMAHIFIYADRKEFLRSGFKRFFVRFMKGAHRIELDRIAKTQAEKMSAADREAVRVLREHARRMIVLSCGTADLCKRILKTAGLDDCFDTIEGNWFTFKNDRITGMTYNMKDPEDKMAYLQNNGFSPENTIAIGDGYTDIPMLDWAGIPVLVDRTGQKQSRLVHKRYQFIASLPQLLEIIRTAYEI
jgi:phosphoserine phosphatase